MPRDASAPVLLPGIFARTVGEVTREEGGFFSRLADGPATVGVGSLRFDLRGHGESEGRQEELTIAGVLNDIQAATDHVRQLFDCGPVHLIGTSFGGGISALFAARHPREVKSLTLMNPLLNYKKRFIGEAVLEERHDRRISWQGAGLPWIPGALAYVSGGTRFP
ncbi:alpha/beta hydrolase [Streptomyces sp. NPDC012829]